MMIDFSAFFFKILLHFSQFRRVYSIFLSCLTKKDWWQFFQKKMLCTFSMGPPFLFRAVLIYELSIDFFKKPVRFQSSLMKMYLSQTQKRLCESMSLNIREAFNRRQTSNKLMFMGEGRAFNHGCHNKSKEVMPFPTRFQHLCVFSIERERPQLSRFSAAAAHFHSPTKYNWKLAFFKKWEQ